MISSSVVCINVLALKSFDLYRRRIELASNQFFAGSVQGFEVAKKASLEFLETFKLDVNTCKPSKYLEELFLLPPGLFPLHPGHANREH